MSAGSQDPTPVVLLHGFTGCGDSWSEVVQALPSRPRVLSPNLLGHGVGWEEEGGAVYDFESEVDRLAAEIRRRGFAGSHLVGYSLGGRVALGLAVARSELFRRVTLIGTHPGLETEAERAARRRSDEEWVRRLETEGLESFLQAWEELPLFASQRALSPGVQEAQRRLRRQHNPRGLARSLRVLGLAEMPNYRLALPRLEVPIRLLVGELDAKFQALAQVMEQRLPEAVVEVVLGVGHNVVLESPEAVARVIIRSDQEDLSEEGKGESP